MHFRTKHQGWNTYETWLVARWMDNDWLTYNRWKEFAYHCWKSSPESERVKEWNWSLRDAAEAELALLLDRVVKDGNPLIQPSIYTDLLKSALVEVDWREIADCLLHVVTSEQALKVGGANTP